jgi:hypothetical protein
VEGFDEIVKNIYTQECPLRDPIDVLQYKMRALRRKIKGWSYNIDAEMKMKKN